MDSVATLVESAREGDNQAFEVLVARFRDYAHSQLYRMVGDYQLAQDAVQEAFTEAYLNLDKLHEPAAFPGWFRRILIKRGDRLIRKSRLTLVPLEEGRFVADGRRAAPEEWDDEYVADAVELALDALPEHERAVARDYYLEELAQKEISAARDLPVTTIKKRLYTSRKRMKQSLRDLAPECNEYEPGVQLDAIAQLYAAAWSGYPSKAHSVLKANPELSRHVNDDGLSVLLFAAHAAHHSRKNRVPEVLLSLGATLDPFTSAALGYRRQLEERVQRNPAILTERGPWGRIPLHWAASGGHVELAEWLLWRGGSVNARDDWGCTPLHLAAETGHMATVKLLLRSGADARTKLKTGKTPLHLAARAGHVAIMETLLKAGASFDVFAAASMGAKDAVERFIRRDRQLLTARLSLGATPLHMAAEGGQSATAAYLVDEGAPVDVVCAAELGWLDRIGDLIHDSPAAVNAKGGSFGFTALHTASIHGRPDVARLLLAHGAEVNAIDDMYHKTPLAEALYFGKEALANLLSRHGGEI